MFSVFLKDRNGTSQTFDNVNNISVTAGRILLVVNHNKMCSYRPADLQEVRFCWNGKKKGETEN